MGSGKKSGTYGIGEGLLDLKPLRQSQVRWGKKLIILFFFFIKPELFFRNVLTSTTSVGCLPIFHRCAEYLGGHCSGEDLPFQLLFSSGDPKASRRR